MPCSQPSCLFCTRPTLQQAWQGLTTASWQYHHGICMALMQDRHHRSSRSSKHGRDRDRSRSRDRDRDHHKSSKSSHRDRTPPKRIPVRQRRPTGFDVLPHQVWHRSMVQGLHSAPLKTALHQLEPFQNMTETALHCDVKLQRCRTWRLGPFVVAMMCCVSLQSSPLGVRAAQQACRCLVLNQQLPPCR